MNASTILVAIRVLLGAMLLSLGCLWSLSAAAQQQDDYAAMLGYLAAVGRIDGQAFSGSGGAVRINQAAGDLNLQSNLQGMAVGQQALVQIEVWQRHAGDSATAPLRATVAIADGAFTDANGLYSINQVAGSGNAQFNAVAATLARLGIQEADDAAMATDAAMPAGGRRRRWASRGHCGRRKCQRPRCTGFEACCNSTRSRDPEMKRGTGWKSPSMADREDVPSATAKTRRSR